MKTITSLLLLITLLHFQLEVTSRCNKVSRFENGLPASLKYIKEDDYIGRTIVWFQAMLRNVIKSMPEYLTTLDDLCQTRLLRMSEYVYIKWALRPKGCCDYCCLIDKIEDHLSLYLFKKDNTVKVLKLSDKKKRGTLDALGFNNESKTLIWAHGYTEDGYFSRSGSVIADAYLKNHDDYNVFVLDYSEIALIPWFLEAVDNIKLAAKAVTKFLKFYHKTGELRIDKIHLNGLSMGAHMAAQLAKELAKFIKPARLTGLDPSVTIYTEVDFDENFSKDDAEFVDIIHSSSGIYRDIKPTGHVDFYVDYPQDMTFRPGCDLLKMGERGEWPYYFICDHIRAMRLFVQTISEPHLFPVCNTNTDKLNSTTKVCGYLGFAANKSTTFGEYHLTTPLDWNPWKGIDFQNYTNQYDQNYLGGQN